MTQYTCKPPFNPLPKCDPPPLSLDEIELRRWCLEQAVLVGPGRCTTVELAEEFLAFVKGERHQEEAA